MLFICLALTLVSSVIASCGHGLEFVEQFTNYDSAPGQIRIPTSLATNFSYDTTTGPFNWHYLDPPFNEVCGRGLYQSPILLDSSRKLAPMVQLDIPVKNNVTFENLGTTVEVVMNKTGRLYTSPGQAWDLVQFHFHTPSEHRIDLSDFEAEMHMVFSGANSDNKLLTAVVGFLVQVEATSTTGVLEDVFAHLGAIEHEHTHTTIPVVNMTDFQTRANSLKYYQYAGSLTTPPCREGVSWFVATTPIPLKVDTYRKLKRITKTNNRFTQNTPGQPNILVVASKGLCVNGFCS